MGRARDFLHGSLAAARALPRQYPGAVAALLPLTAAAFTLRAATAYAVFRAFQETGHLSELITALIILILALFFAPTPGASGFAEAASTAYLVGALGPATSVGFPTFCLVSKVLDSFFFSSCSSTNCFPSSRWGPYQPRD